MKIPRPTPKLSDLNLLLLLAAIRFGVHMLTNGQYGFHRDELAILDEARTLAWGYVAYPPLTPAIGRAVTELFGLSLVGIRAVSALAQCAGMVVTGLMARELGGQRRAVVVAAIAAAIAPMSLIQGALFQYVSFDYLWWVVSAYAVIRLLKSEDARWWLIIGGVLGLGMMTKSTMAFWIAGIVGGVLLTPRRRDLGSPWLWAGVGLSVLIFLPNLLWQWRNDFVALDFLSTIHARDVAIGRADGFFFQQFLVSANPFTTPLWMAGLYFVFFSVQGRRYRMVGWMYVIPLVLLAAAQARFYYLYPAYPMLLAAGAVWGEGWLAERSQRAERVGWGVTWAALALGALIGAALTLPVAPVNSGLWRVVENVHDNFVEQIGWPDLLETVADLHARLPAEERARTGILAGNYGEAGAINLFGADYGLPPAISGVNGLWARGYGDPPPESLIVLGFSQGRIEGFFASCQLIGQITNRYGVANLESRYTPDIFLCRQPRQPWPELWQRLRSFG